MVSLTGQGRISGINDETIAHDVLAGAKMLSTSAASAMGEAATPEVKQFFERCLRDSTEDHGRLMQIMMKKGWYQPYAAPEEQLAMDMQKAQNLISGKTQGAMEGTFPRQS